jgi:hypothetical protein
LARKEIGLIKAVEIINNPKYASNLFIQATFSENTELISLTKILDRELNIDVNLIKAIESYINTLKKNNKSSYFIHRSKYYLLKLSDHVYGIETNGISYRHAVDALVASIDIDDKTFCINLSRSFYPFWKNAYSTLIDMLPEQSIQTSIKHKEFADLWNSANELFLSDSESWFINHYKNAMQRAGASESEVEARIKMAKLILNELRNHGQTSGGFRTAVEIIGAKFLRDQTRDYLQVVSREFYPFWMDSDSKTEA